MKTGTFFEVNVSQKGKHLFATDTTTRSYDAEHVAMLLELLNEKFPESDGYSISVTTWVTGVGKLPDAIAALTCEIKKTNSTKQVLRKDG